MKTHLRNQQNKITLISLALLAMEIHKNNTIGSEHDLQSIQLSQGDQGGAGSESGKGTSGVGGNQSGRKGSSDDFDDTDEPQSNLNTDDFNSDQNNTDPDVVGKTTGRTVDESILDQTDGGTTANMYSSSDGATTTGQVTTPSEAVDSESENYGAGKAIKSGDVGSSNAGKGYNSPGGKYVEVPRKPTDRLPGTGSGAASNDRGERIEDIDSGTGSAQRGNQAGVDDPDEGTIIDL